MIDKNQVIKLQFFEKKNELIFSELLQTSFYYYCFVFLFIYDQTTFFIVFFYFVFLRKNIMCKLREKKKPDYYCLPINESGSRARTQDIQTFDSI